MASEKNHTNLGETTPPRPCPGDGICPTVLEFQGTIRNSYNLWSSLLSETDHSPSLLRTADLFLDFIQRIPPFATPALEEGFSILDVPFPQVEYTLEWKTTTHTGCSRPIKQTRHYHTLGITEPVEYKFLEVSEPGLHIWLDIDDDQAKYLTHLIFAWTFILSSRWVEILKDAGEEVHLHLKEEIDHKNFWKIVTEQQWQATIIRGQNAFYAPWSLREVHKLPHEHLPEASPNSSYAFDLLLGFCESEGIVKECVAAALSIVLMLPDTSYGLIKLPPPTAKPDFFFVQHPGNIYYRKLFEYLNCCITLSCIPEGISSLLCSVLFDPQVPCNLVGAHFLGVAEAIKPVKYDPQKLACLMASRSPELSPLWLAAIWSGRAIRILKSAMNGLPPISLPIASWTATLQSFLQAEYLAATHQIDFIPRAYEYSIIYLAGPTASMPFTPSPPFGETATSNLSLDVRKHLSHGHRPTKYRTYWLSKKGAPLQGQDKWIDMPRLDVFLPSVAKNKDTKILELNFSEEEANAVSEYATFNLFYWYKNNEGGLWLGKDQDNIQVVRRLQSHPWITYDSDEETCSEIEQSDKVLDKGRIESWRYSIAMAK